MSDKPDNRRRLSDLMERRRTELGLTWKEVAVAGGISYEAIRAVRHGDADIRSQTKHGIDVGLRWQPGSVQAVLDGGEPVQMALAAMEPLSVDDFTEEDVERLLTDDLELMIFRSRGFTFRERLEKIEALRRERARYGQGSDTGNTGSADALLAAR